MAPDVPTSRRAVLSGVAAGLLGYVMAAIGRPTIALAGNDGDVVLGANNSGTATTQLQSGGLGVFSGPVIRADAGIPNATAGVLGTIASGTDAQPTIPGGVVGLNTSVNRSSSAGVVGHGLMTPGIVGDSSFSTGMVAISESGSASALLAWSKGAQTGVFGYSGNGVGTPYGTPGPWEVDGPAMTGVMGFTDLTFATATGVLGEAREGIGVHGHATTGTGVVATATSGTALRVTGKISLSRSGRKAIAAGHSSLAVVMSAVTTSSYVVATLQTNRAGTWVQSVVPSSGKFTIYLNKVVTSATYVAFVVIN